MSSARGDITKTSWWREYVMASPERQADYQQYLTDSQSTGNTDDLWKERDEWTSNDVKNHGGKGMSQWQSDVAKSGMSEEEYWNSLDEDQRKAYAEEAAAYGDDGFKSKYGQHFGPDFAPSVGGEYWGNTPGAGNVGPAPPTGGSVGGLPGGGSGGVTPGPTPNGGYIDQGGNYHNPPGAGSSGGLGGGGGGFQPPYIEPGFQDPLGPGSPYTPTGQGPPIYPGTGGYLPPNPYGNPPTGGTGGGTPTTPPPGSVGPGGVGGNPIPGPGNGVPATPPGGTGTTPPGTTPGGAGNDENLLPPGVQQLLDDWKASQDEAKAANEERYAEILAGYQARGMSYAEAQTAAQAELQANLDAVNQGYNDQLANFLDAQTLAAVQLSDQYNTLNQGYSTRETEMRDVLNRPYQSLDAIGQSERRDIAARTEAQLGSSDQDLTNRGLGNTTVRSSAQRGIYEDENRAYLDLADRMARLQIGVDQNYANSLGTLTQQPLDAQNQQIATQNQNTQNAINNAANIQGQGLNAQFQGAQIGYNANQQAIQGQDSITQQQLQFMENRNDTYPDMASMIALLNALGQGNTGYGTVGPDGQVPNTPGYGGMPSTPTGGTPTTGGASGTPTTPTTPPRSTPLPGGGYGYPTTPTTPGTTTPTGGTTPGGGTYLPSTYQPPGTTAASSGLQSAPPPSPTGMPVSPYSSGFQSGPAPSPGGMPVTTSGLQAGPPPSPGGMPVTPQTGAQKELSQAHATNVGYLGPSPSNPYSNPGIDYAQYFQPAAPGTMGTQNGYSGSGNPLEPTRQTLHQQPQSPPAPQPPANPLSPFQPQAPGTPTPNYQFPMDQPYYPSGPTVMPSTNPYFRPNYNFATGGQYHY